MSLLMEALKKAEQEKKEAAKRLKESETEQQLGGLEDAHGPGQDQSGERNQPAPVLPRLENTITGEHSPAVELSLTPIHQQSVLHGQAQPVNEADQPARENEVKPPDLALQAAPDADAAGAPEEDTEKARREFDELDSHEQELDLLDQTFHGVDLKGEAIAKSVFDDTVEEVLAPEAPYHEETLPGVPAVQFAKDLGGEDLPTPVAAQTVFSATDKYNRATSGFRWLLIGCSVAAVLAGSIWYYYTVTPINVDLPSPLVAKGIESQIPAQPVDLPDDVISGILVEDPEAAAETQADPSQQPPAEPGVAVADKEIIAAAEADAEIPAPSAPVVTSLVAGANEVNPARDTSPQDLPESIELSPSLIKISRSKGVDQKGQLINEAYAAYMAEDFSTAREKYEQVLVKQPDNRDALLGMGAVATRGGDALTALQAYSRLLRLNPKDKLARALLVNLQSSTDIVRSESAVKVMIHENPDLPYLYFTLGNIYANQSRWVEAQQAFFDAYRQDTSNPDYALNLAVSLDKIGKLASALDYYNTALKLSDERSASFDPALVISRIETISSLEKP